MGKRFFCYLFIVGFICMFLPNSVKADDVWLQIDGTPLTIQADDCAQMGILYGVTRQYFGINAKGSVLFLDGTSQQFSMGAVPAGGCGGTLFTPVSHNKPDDWSIETVYDAGATGVRVTQRIYYTNGNYYYRLEWDMENTGSTTYTDCRFLHGGDTYFDGNDNSRGYYNAVINMVYLKNPNNEDAGIMGLYGHPSSLADRYHENDFTTNWNEMDDGELPNTVNGDDLDAGYSVQWNRSTLAPGNTWQIVAFEKWTGAGSVQVYAPADEDVSAGEVKSYTFIVQSFQAEPATYDLSASSSNGWATNLPGGSSITLDPDEADSMIVELTVPAGTAGGTTDELTLTATDESDAEITNSDFVTSTVPEYYEGDDTDDGGSSGAPLCFLEGFSLAPDDIMLCRRFRDENLLANPAGILFVSTYYRASPFLVGLTNNYPALKGVAREILRPVVWLLQGNKN
ncbi:MAG: hypothetical protein KJ887_02300 [Candidatus Omnitrophica bacterium]|nr:hypothetical protein [Candidatus Omnitrophota bacterium]MBU1047894.1 hypothetical protein [Candidatus Omnitrophota bacterium]MBU1631469.1 hypothetical protein [Candidatus Omnitrophota bacterium]MBU1888517.1 hypothetical protein [Candidatus Omnitrophota bacterium]